MKAISTGNVYRIYDDTLKTYDKLPAQPYVVRFAMHTGFYLERYSDIEITEDKIYGVHPEKVLKVLDSFSRYNRSLGVILSGDKGIGKSLFAKLLAIEAMKKGLPLIIVDRHIGGIASYLESIEQEVMVLFDEFDKPHPVFHSAFYQLFDEGIYVDRNFTVKMKDSVIICTSNYMSEKEIRTALGEPIFSRFDAVIKFEKLNKEAIQKIMEKEYDKQYSVLDETERGIIESYQIKDKILALVEKLDNARQIRRIIREAFSAALIRELL